MTAWQNDARWGSLMCGHGPGRIGDVGCVLSSLTEAANRFTPRNLNPATLNMVLQKVPGAFVDGTAAANPGDELVLPIACGQVGLECGESLLAPAGSSSLVDALKAALGDGGAFLRIDINGDGKGDHTILAVRDIGHVIECTDSAWPRQEGVAGGYAMISWDGLSAEVWWNKTFHTYRVVGVRAVRSSKQ